MVASKETTTVVKHSSLCYKGNIEFWPYFTNNTFNTAVMKPNAHKVNKKKCVICMKNTIRREFHLANLSYNVFKKSSSQCRALTRHSVC